MAIARKPVPTPAHPDRKRTGAGETVESSRRDHAQRLMTMVPLRYPVELNAKVEASLKRRSARISRNSWIIEAIDEKLKRERDK